MEHRQQLRWIKVNNKTICEKLENGEWVEHEELNSKLSNFFHDSDFEPNKKSNIIIKMNV